MKFKKLYVIPFVVFFTLSSSVFIFAQNGRYLDKENVQPYDLLIDNGTLINAATGFERTFILNKNNGDYVNFWIHNNGNIPVSITINGGKAKIFKKGEGGHISEEVTGKKQSFKFRAVSAENGGNINIDYKIAQRNN